MAYPAGFYNDPRMPLMYAIRAEGITCEGAEQCFPEKARSLLSNNGERECLGKRRAT